MKAVEVAAVVLARVVLGVAVDVHGVAAEHSTKSRLGVNHT